MQSLIQHLKNGLELTAEQIEQAVAALVSTDITGAVKADFLIALRAKGETAEDLAAFANALTARAIIPDLDRSALRGPTIDVCGTGGDKQGYFNVSTTVMFVAAAAGACVMKHGNRSITSKTGAADVLEELGVKIDLSPAELRESLERHGLAFIFARSYHPAFAAIGPVRAALAKVGHSTIFNLLGPLLNPARPDYQLAGVYSPALLQIYSGALRAIGRKNAWTVHGDGTDELSLTGPSEIALLSGEKITITPEELGLPRCQPADLLGGERGENAAIVTGILEGTIRGPKRDIVLLNTAAALTIAQITPGLKEGIALAAETIDNRTAHAKLIALRSQAQ